MSGGSTHLSYQWYSGPTSTGSWTIISGATSSTYSVPSGAPSSLWYRITVIDSTSGCFDPTSPAIQVSVVNDPVVTIIPIDSVNCLGDPILLTLTVSGGTGTNQYFWNVFDGAGWNQVGGDVAAFDPGVLPSGVYKYRVIVLQNSGCEAVSADYDFNVIGFPEGSLSSTPGSCGNNEGTITVTFTDHPLASGIQISLDGGNTYFPSIPDSLETATYTNLAPNIYSVWAKWDTDDCAVFIDSIPVTELACGSICGQVTDDTGQPISNVEIRIYRDLNNNDVFDSGETLFGTVYTDGDTGDYCLEDIPAGEYVVFEVQPANYNSVSDYDHSTNAPDTDGYAGINDPDDMIPATVLPGEPDMDNDFIEDPFLGSISGNVSDDGAANLVNIVVNLYADVNADGVPDGAILATRLTDANGNYLFAGIEPDDYVVTQINLPLHSDVSDYDHTTSAADPDGNDTVQGPDGNIPVHVAPGEADDDNDFVDGRPGTICGTVSNDVNQPLSNVEILLFHDVNNNDSIDGGDVHIATQFTDGDSGDYCFEDVTPGEYIVVEIQPAYHTSVSDYDHSTGAFDNDGYPGMNDPDDQIVVTLMPVEQDFDNDFIEDGLVGTISGTVHNEVGAPIFGVMISLHLDTNADGNPDGVALATALTNTTGEYVFTGVEAGFYVLVETSPMFHSAISDYDHTTTAPDLDGDDSGQGPDDNIPVRLTAGESDEDNNFVDGRPGIICGSVKNDLRQPLSSVELRLYRDVNNNDSFDIADVLMATTYTDGDTGDYCFEDVTPGEYVVFEVQPISYSSVSDYDHTTVAPDTDGYASGNDPDNEIPCTLTPYESDMDNNFIEDPIVGAISGKVTNDANAPISGVEIRLYNDTNGDGNADGAAISTTFTNSSGDYLFTGVEPAYYVVIEITPLYYSSISDYDHSILSSDLDGDDSGQGPDNNIPVQLLPAESDTDNDFKDGRPGMICGTVSDDTGLPISSVEIRLYLDVNNNDSLDVVDTLIATTYTDGDTGNYCFEDVTPGDYVVFEIQPVNYASVADYDYSTAAPDTDGNDSVDGPDDEIPVTVVPAELDNDNDFIEDAFTGSISGHIEDDVLNNLSGVQVRLHNDTNNDGAPDGAPISTTFTNTSGDYIFTGVEPGTYVVVEISPLYYSDISDYDHSTMPPTSMETTVLRVLTTIYL